jgi:hypothetical protein
MTATTIVSAALNLLGLLRAGQTPSTVETAVGIAALNTLIDSWNTERLNIFTVGIASYPLTTATQSYTIGPSGAAITAARPIKIEGAGMLIPNTGNSGLPLRMALKILTKAEWDGIEEKSSTADYSEGLYDDMNFPTSTLYLWPIPVFSGNGTTLEISAWVALVSFPDLTTDVPLNIGYSRALQYALAIELAPHFKDAVLGPSVIQIANESKDGMRALNAALGDQEPTMAPTNATPDGGK